MPAEELEVESEKRFEPVRMFGQAFEEEEALFRKFGEARIITVIDHLSSEKLP